MKFFLTGAHGTGKTSLMNALPDSIFKLEGITRRTIEENNLNINQQSNSRSQTSIFDAYEHQLSENDNYLAERSLVDVIAYTLYLAARGKLPMNLALDQVDRTIKFIKDNPDSIYFYLPIEFEIEDDGTRSTDKDFQYAIDKQILLLLTSYNVKIYKVTGTIEERARFVKNIIEQNSIKI